MMVTTLSGAVVTRGVGAAELCCASRVAAALAKAGKRSVSSIAPPAVALALRKLRRDVRPADEDARPAESGSVEAGERRSWDMALRPLLRVCGAQVGPGGMLDGFLNAQVCAAAANVAIHRRDDVIVARRRRTLQQRRGRHDLAGLAIAALHHVNIEPRFLQSRTNGGVADALDGRYRRIADGRDRQRA